MAEQINLTVPYQPDPRTAADLTIKKIVLDWEGQNIVVILTKADIRKEISWGGAAALTLMVALNKANLTTTSLQKRVLQQAIADGKLAGTISGAPD